MNRGLHWLRAGRRDAGVALDIGHATPRDREIMARALALAAAAAGKGEVPVGAVVYRTDTGEILGEGANQREGENDPIGHAEVLAISAAAKTLGDWRLEGCSLAVTLEPCMMCAGAIVNSRVPRLVYGADDPKAGAVRSLRRVLSDPRLNHRAQIVPGVLSEECGRVLREFFAQLRRSREKRRAGTS